MADNYDENKPRFPYWLKAPTDPYDSQTSRIPNTTPSLDSYDWQTSRIEKMDELIRSYSESYSLISKAELDYERLRQLNVESSRNFDYAGMAMAAAGAAAKSQLEGAAIGFIGGKLGMPAGAVDPLKPDPAMAMLAPAITPATPRTNNGQIRELPDISLNRAKLESGFELRHRYAAGSHHRRRNGAPSSGHASQLQGRRALSVYWN